MAPRKDSSGARISKVRDIALKKLPADPNSNLGRDLRRRVSQVTAAYQNLESRMTQRANSRSRAAALQQAERQKRRLAAEATLAELEKQLRASQRSGDAALIAHNEDVVAAARGHLMLIDSVTRNNEQTDRILEEQDRNLLASAANLAIAAIESVHRTDGAQRFEVALKSAVAVGTIAGGFTYPILAAAVSAAQAAIDLVTGSSAKRRLRKEDAATARQEAAVVFLKITEELLKS